MPRHNPHLTPLRNNPRTIPPNHPRLVLRPQRIVDHQLVALRDAFGDGDNEGDFGLDGFEDGGGGEGGGDVDDRGVGAFVLSGLGERTGKGGVRAR